MNDVHLEDADTPTCPICQGKMIKDRNFIGNGEIYYVCDKWPNCEGNVSTGKKDKVRLLPSARTRVETGAVQFGAADWPGLFIRGDDAFNLAYCIRVVAASVPAAHLMADPNLRIALARLDYYSEIIKSDVLSKSEENEL